MLLIQQIIEKCINILNNRVELQLSELMGTETHSDNQIFG